MDQTMTKAGKLKNNNNQILAVFSLHNRQGGEGVKLKLEIFFGSLAEMF